MTEAETHAVLAITILGALADGQKDDRERQLIRELAEDLPGEGEPLPGLYRQVLLKRLRLADLAPQLASAESRQLAFEMAVCVIEADGNVTNPEQRFLNELRGALQLDDGNARAFVAEADELTHAPETEVARGELPTASTPTTPPAAGSQVARTYQAGAAIPPVPTESQPPATKPQPDVPATPPTPVNQPDTAELDRMVTKYAILCGALELLPQSLATLAIIPMQTKMVYRIGQRYGAGGSMNQAKALLTTAGLGLGSQVLDGFARKFMGKLGKSAFGSLGKSLGRTAGSSALAFATTWALGKLAIRYYADGQRLDRQAIKETFTGFLRQGNQLQGQYQGQIQQEARTMNLSQVLKENLPGFSGSHTGGRFGLG